jgi:hypothetical protein
MVLVELLWGRVVRTHPFDAFRVFEQVFREPPVGDFRHVPRILAGRPEQDVFRFEI